MEAHGPERAEVDADDQRAVRRALKLSRALGSLGTARERLEEIDVARDEAATLVRVASSAVVLFATGA